MSKDKNIQDIAGKENTFKVPEGYFENLTSAVMERLEEQTFEKQHPITMWERLRPYVYMAAMFVGIFLLIKVYTGMTVNNRDTNTAYIEFSTEDMLLSSIDEYTFYEYLTSDED